MSSARVDQRKASEDPGALTTPEYWDGFFRDVDVKPGFAFFDEIAAHLPKAAGASFLEIGSGPGGILAEFCRRLGYEAHGIDYASDPERVRSFLEGLGVQVGQIHRGDIFAWDPLRKFDIVASFGFVEHFKDPARVVDLHFSMVRPGGIVVVTFPNFARGQWLLHRLFDRAILEGHNLSCMNLSFLRKAALRNRADPLYLAYTGGHFTFWHDSKPRGRVQAFLMWRSAGLASRFAHFFLPARNSLFSPYIVAVFRAAG